MKRFLVLIYFLSAIVALQAQHPTERWRETIKQFERQDQQNGIPEKPVLFVGSSTFTMWEDLQQRFNNLSILNRAFGGSVLHEVLYFYDDLVTKYSPESIFLYEGDNDLSKASYSVDDFMKDVNCFVRLTQIKLPETKLHIVSVKPSPVRSKEILEKYKQANEELKKLCSRENIPFIDTASKMYNSNGSIKQELFLKDNLHMNASGYDIWEKEIQKYLK